MSPYTPNDAFAAPEIYDISDLVKGGFDGDANKPIQAIFDQTNYLKNRLGSWMGIKVLTDNYAYNVSDLNKYFVFRISANKAFTLPDVGDLMPGSRIGITAIIPVTKALTVQSQLGQAMIDGTIAWVKWDDGTQPAMYLHDGDKLILIAAGDHWIVESAIGNFYCAGESFSARKVMRNCIAGDGSVYQRADIPRVSLYALDPRMRSIISDALWLVDATSYRGLYSTGNGTTTIRVPDERGMFERFLDNGRGLDNNRLVDLPGGFEDQMVGPHNHRLVVPQDETSVDANGTGRFTTGSTALEPRDMNPVFTDNNLGSETIVKNIAKLSLIPY